MNKGLQTSKSTHYGTPKWLYDLLNQEFHFNDDPCPLGEGIDGLLRSWQGPNVFINPPYGKRNLEKWLNKAVCESEQGKTVVALLPARTDTKWWHDYCMNATEFRFIKGRVCFEGGGRSPFPSVVVIFRKDDSDIPEIKLIHAITNEQITIRELKGWNRSNL